MPYPAIISRRIPYDIDGTVVGYSSTNNFINGVTSWLSSSVITELNDEDVTQVIRVVNPSYWFWFPEKIEIEAAIFLHNKEGGSVSFVMEGSNDTTNGTDGTWETATFPSGSPAILTDSYAWRSSIKVVSFSESKKVIRIRASAGSYLVAVHAFHIYGRKAFGETPDDILICDINGNELTTLMDWEDRPEATEQIKFIKLKNASTTKTANNVNLQLNHADFGMSFNVAGSWTATLDIPNIPPNGLSEPIYIKNTIGLPPQILGPKAGRLIVGVNSWT